jgi:hypothetical protein
VRVFVAGTQMNPVIDANITLSENQPVTVAATGFVGNGSLGPVVCQRHPRGVPQPGLGAFRPHRR